MEAQRTPKGPAEVPAPAKARADAPAATARQRMRGSVRGMGFQAGRQALSPAARPEPTPVAEPLVPEAPQVAPSVAAAAASSPAVVSKAEARKKGQLKGLSFQEVWAAHPHNYQDDPSQNQSSAEVLEDQGWDPQQYGNTCAIRMSVMLNTIGGAYAITPARAATAGIPRSRLAYSKKTGWYYILAAKEMWTYVKARFGKPHASWPAQKTYKDAAAFELGFRKEILPTLSGKKGLVAFEKIFGYSGTGHVDVFNGEQLSDAPAWYPCQRLEVWYL